jgi:hypothetical protein
MIILAINTYMPISTNILLKQLKGTLGKQVVIKQYGDKTVVTNYPDMSNRKLSAKQIEANEQMKMANIYAKSLMKNKEEKDAALLRLKVPENKLYRALIKEFMLKKGEI